MMNFVALDLETATSVRSSICEIGITEVIDSVPQQSKSWLVQPEGNEYYGMNIAVHGITPEDTKCSPLFPEVWEEVQPYLQNKIVVAHYTGFDMNALKDAFDKYNIEYPTFDYFCTFRFARYIVKGCYSYSLEIVTDYLGIDYGIHHRAGSDSLGCALLCLKCFEMDGSTFDDLEAKYNFHRGKFAPGVFKGHQAIEKPYESYSSFIKSLNIDPYTIDESNYFFGKTICFTGTCQWGTRKELMQKVAEIGGIPAPGGVTAKTDVLVVGQQDYRVVGDSGMSSKQRKAFSLLEKGQEIEILSEIEFLSRI